MSKYMDDLEQERNWVEQSRKDISCFKPIYEKYVDPLFRFFLRRTDDESLADDLCSTTFFKALDRLETFRWQGKPFGAWLFQIASNELRKHFRDKKHVYVLEEEHLDCTEDLLDIHREGHLELLIELLDELNETDLRILELKYFEGLGFREISTLMELGESATKMRVYRVLEKLKNEMMKKQ